MGRYVFISGCVIAAFYIAGVTSAEALAAVSGFLADNRTPLLASGLIGALALVCASLIFGGIGFFNVLYLMAKAVYELVQFLLCIMALATMVFWFDLGVNFWFEGGGALAIVLYVWLYGAAFSLRVFDFNYPVRDALLAFSVLPFACMVVIMASSLIW